MRADIYCVENEGNNNGLAFYLRVGNESYYLFNQKWRSDVKRYFTAGVSVDRALKQNTRKTPTCIRRVVEKLPGYIHYIEQEYDVVVLNKTKKRAMMC